MKTTKWAQARDDHRVVIVNVLHKDEQQHPDLIQKFLSQAWVVEARSNYAHRYTTYTLLHPELPPVPHHYMVPGFILEVDLTTRTPSAYLGWDQLLKVSL